MGPAIAAGLFFSSPPIAAACERASARASTASPCLCLAADSMSPSGRRMSSQARTSATSASITPSSQRSRGVRASHRALSRAVTAASP
jgi:hypothetical protein